MKEKIQICEPQGKIFAIVPSEEFIAELKRRAASPGPWYSGEDVQAMFRFLEDARLNEGDFDDARLKTLMDEFEAQHGKPS